MSKVEAIIFDMDGTLYSFDERAESEFSSSAFGRTIHSNCVRFFEQRLCLNQTNAIHLFEDLKRRYNGEVSLAVEQEFGIDRSEYFAFTWNLQVEKFIVVNQELISSLQAIALPMGVLTAAPSIWAERALRFLHIRELFGKAVFTGEPNIRKPNPLAFMQLAQLWKLTPDRILSFSIESPEVFALLDMLKAFGAKAVYDKGYLVTVTDLNRVADGTYLISGSMNYARATDLAELGDAK